MLRRGAERAVLHVAEEGLYLLEPRPIEPVELLDAFVERGLLNPSHLAEARARVDGPKVLDTLVEEGSLDESVLLETLSSAAEDAILDLLAWSSGEFRFEEDQAAPSSSSLVSRIAVDVGGVLLRTVQRLDERAAIADVLGLQAHLFMPVPGVAPPDSDDQEAAIVHAGLDGSTTVDELALRTGLGRFTALRAVYHCVIAGAARAAMGEELRGEIARRADAGDWHVARNLCLQWAGLDATDPEPLETLITLAEKFHHLDAKADALQTLGYLHVQRNRAAEAVAVFQTLTAMRPGDVTALSGLRTAAEYGHEMDVWGQATLTLAEVHIDQDEASQALKLLTTLLEKTDAPMAAHVLRGRALVRLRDRDGLVHEAEAVLALLEGNPQGKSQREAAAYFRDAVANLVPERSDLLRRLRGLERTRGSRGKRVALVVALLAVAGTVGFVALRKNPTKMLAEARAAATTGQNEEALRIIASLMEEFPDAPETDAAITLHRQLVRRPEPPPSAPLPDAELRKEYGTTIALTLETLPRLPAVEAREALRKLTEILRKPEATTLRGETVRHVAPALHKEVRRMAREALQQADTIALTRDVASGRDFPTQQIDTIVASAIRHRDAGYADAVSETVGILEALHVLTGEGDGLPHLLDEARSGASRLRSAIEDHGVHIDASRRMLALREVEDAYERCRTEAPRLLVSGRLTEVKACYQALDDKIRALGDDPALLPLLESVRRRHYLEFVEDRRAVIREIEDVLAGARAAEEAGDLEAAAEAYAGLASKYWHIRFENVFTIPLFVNTTPKGATVRVNGVAAGETPLVVRYGWGTRTTLTFEHKGYETVTEVLGADAGTPVSRLTVALPPTMRWHAPVDATVTAAPLGINGDVLVCDRSGRVVLHDAGTGEVRWARHIRRLEGIRSTPVESSGLIYLPFVDGTLVLIRTRDGSAYAEREVGRPVGNPAVLGDLVAVATMRGEVVAVRGDAPAFRIPVGDTLTTGVISAHDALWTGTADGRLVRITHGGASRIISLGDNTGSIVGISAHADGLLVSSSEGALRSVDREGKFRWHAGAVGDVSGTPARAGSTAAVIDGRGRVLMFDIDTGDPKGQVDLRGQPRGGLLASGSLLVSYLADGRLWVYDADRREVRVERSLDGTALFLPAFVGSELLALPAQGQSLGVVRLAASSPR